MERTAPYRGIIRIRFGKDENGLPEPVTFEDEKGVFLRQVSMTCTPRPVFRLVQDEEEGEVKQTANGEVVVFDDGPREQLRISRSVVLRFACPDGHILAGLGQHEDGIFDCSRAEERLYQHNMKIAIPFLLCSAGWGLLIEAGCAMRFSGEKGGFSFTLDAAGEICYTVIRGADCAEVLRLLSLVSGKPAMLPKWAFGYVQSRERYHSAEELTDTAREFRKRGLGLDCIVQDWFTWKEGCWGDKTPDPERFPDIRALTDELHGMHVRLMVSVWPNTAKGRDCDEFERAGMFLPGSRIYDAFSPAAREQYWRQCRRYWMDGGTDALWCDSCEPITDPDWCGDTKRGEDERMRLLTEASALRMDPERMNDYGAEHLRGLREHWLRDFPGKRPVLLSRSGGIDASALGAVLWSGDVAARWEVLRDQVTEGIRIACSGICWWTLDIGAFFVGKGQQWFWCGDYPDGVKDPAYRELYIRWFQFGAMLPMFRSHGTDTPREPWQFGDEDSPEYRCIRDIIALRYRLLPYFYSTAAQCCREGLPMIRAMMVAFPEETGLHPLHDQYMLGDLLLVKPVTRPLAEGGGETETVLPQGGWYDLFTQTYYAGGGSVTVQTPPERFPILVRAGGILPVAEGAQCADDLPVPAREILVFTGADGACELYDDVGDGFEDGFRIPLCWDDTEQTFTAETVRGKLPDAFEMNVCLIRQDGTRASGMLHYTGKEKRLVFDR